MDESDKEVLDKITDSGRFTLEKFANMYKDVERIKPHRWSMRSTIDLGTDLEEAKRMLQLNRALVDIRMSHAAELEAQMRQSQELAAAEPDKEHLFVSYEPRIEIDPVTGNAMYVFGYEHMSRDKKDDK